MTSNTVNTPIRSELYVLDDDEKFVETSEDTKIPNAATFTIRKQDHTLGNLLRAQLLATPQVLFAGYKVPHPLHPYFIIKVQTDGTMTPTQALDNACNKLIATVGSLETRFKREFSYRDVQDGPAVAQEEQQPYGSAPGWGAGKDYLDF